MENYVPPGTIVLTNSIYPQNNGRWGRFNHAAITFSRDSLIEGIQGQGVVTNKISSLINHPETGEYTFLIPINLSIGEIASMRAYELNGTKYRWWSSAFRITQWQAQKGLNCISVVRYGYEKALNYSVNWRYPDDTLKSSLFRKTEIFNNVQ